MKSSSTLLSAAIAGILSAAAPATTFAADSNAKTNTTPAAAQAAPAAPGHCMGANACKGKSACATATNGCAGQNACKGKGFTETSKDQCEKAMKKDKKVKFEG